jgi:DNA-directed RNA polymerase specialized sigma24 family protein
VTAEARERLLDYIANPATRTSLQAYVRRRGLSDSADDLVQTVLCDALTVEAVPERTSELPRFITGIARNKVVDEQRRRARWKRAELPEDVEAPRSAEARDVLRRIERDVVEPEERRALGWLVREHHGDSLYLMALEQALEPSTLRQRICRLRKSLRARYLAPLAFALGLGAAGSLFQPAAPPASLRPIEAVTRYAGQWNVVEVAPAKYSGMARHVTIGAGRVRVFGPAEALGRELLVERLVGDQVTLRSGTSVWSGRLVPLPGERLRLTTPRGSVVIERVRRD